MDFVLGWNYNDQLYDNVKHTGWHIGYPDAPVRILPEPGREISFELDILFFSLNFPLSLKAALTANPSLHAADKAEFNVDTEPVAVTEVPAISGLFIYFLYRWPGTT